jgi:protein-S-isoprenylcysteine O-methyltransferase Ste14
LIALVALTMPAIAGAVIFVSAGRWDLPNVWAVLGILAGFIVAIALFADRGMMRERRSPGPGNQDRLTRPLGGVLLFAHWILGGMDLGRWQVTVLPWGAQLTGLIGYTVAMALLFWAMQVNPFYSSVVRVQTDRGHRTIDQGPYRWVRHPGYAASLAAMLFGSLALGSGLAMLPILAFMALFVRRTLLEDRMLQRELPGYGDYAQRVRYRLLAGIF